MGYKAKFDQADKTGKVRNLSPTWVPFDQEGTSVCGALAGTNEVASGLGTGTYLQYLMKTDEGLIKFSLGAATDKELKAVIHEGGIYRITYIGQQKIKGGRKVNRFKVEVLGEAEEAEITDEDVPF